MKRTLILCATLASLVLSASLARAETPTTEPSLPGNLSGWHHVVKDVHCNPSPTQSLVQDAYATPMGGGIVRVLLITTRNGERFVQMDVGLLDGVPFNGLTYLKTGGGWLSYDMKEPSEFEKYTKRFTDELGVTVEQYGQTCQDMN